MDLSDVEAANRAHIDFHKTGVAVDKYCYFFVVCFERCPPPCFEDVSATADPIIPGTPLVFC